MSDATQNATDPGLWSATEQAAAIASRQLSSRELTQHLIDRIERLDGDINAVVTRDFDNALAAAAAADKKLATSPATTPDEVAQSLGRLFGVPITVKDALQTKGLRSTGGARELKDNVPDVDASVVATVRSHGAVVMGKTNLPRWSGDNQSFNEIFGTTNNPWDLSRVPGGSSGGAAAAVAMGFTGFEIGTDIGGSIRFPAAFNGVWGHKPSWGAIPTLGYLDHVDGGTTEADINVFGPLARSCDDLELLLGLLVRSEPPWVAQLAEPRFAGPKSAGPNFTEPKSTGPKSTGGSAGLRVAAWLDDDFCRVDSEVLAVLERAVTALEGAGVSVDRSARPAIDPAQAWELGLWLVQAAMMPVRKDAGPSHKEWLANDALRTQIRSAWAEFFASYDAVIMPVSFVPPYEHNQGFPVSERTLTCNGAERPYMEMTGWTIMTGMAYLPATVPPLGITETTKLPVGCQVVGAYGADKTTLAVARLLAEVAPDAGYVPPPLALG